jgi:hypothetical protein
MCDCENPDPRQSDPTECAICGEPLSEKQMFEQFLGQAELVKNLTSRIADLEATLDDIPSMTGLREAVRELQEQYAKPAMTFTHYIRG